MPAKFENRKDIRNKRFNIKTYLAPTLLIEMQINLLSVSIFYYYQYEYFKIIIRIDISMSQGAKM
jgi:hypothetical protein